MSTPTKQTGIAIFQQPCWHTILVLIPSLATHHITSCTASRPSCLYISCIHSHNPTSHNLSHSLYLTFKTDSRQLSLPFVTELDSHTHTQTSALYNQSARAKPFSLHGFVWLHAHPPPHVSPKLFKHWTRPWKIVDTPSQVTYTITAQFPTTPHMQRHRLRLYRTPVDYTPPPLLLTPLTAPTPTNDPTAINWTRTRNVKPPSYFGSPVLQINMSSSRSLTKQYHSLPHSKPPLLPFPPGRRPLLPRPPGNRPLLPRPTPSRTPPRVRKKTPPPRPQPPKFSTKATPCRSISPPPPTSASPFPDPGVTDLLTLYDSDEELLVLPPVQ